MTLLLHFFKKKLLFLYFQKKNYYICAFNNENCMYKYFAKQHDSLRSEYNLSATFSLLSSYPPPTPKYLFDYQSDTCLLTCKFFLTGILSLIACLSLYAAEETTSRMYFGNTAVAGKEYIYSFKQTSAENHRKKAAGIKKETPKPVVESAITEHEPATVVLPDFPFAPSSSAFSRDGRESATISPQQRQDKPQPAVKTF